jgi:hypothetical protein
MAADPVLSRELRSLQDEITASQRARASSLPDHPTASEAKGPIEAAAVPANQPAETAEEEKLRGEFREFLDEASRGCCSRGLHCSAGTERPART